MQYSVVVVYIQYCIYRLPALGGCTVFTEAPVISLVAMLPHCFRLYTCRDRLSCSVGSTYLTVMEVPNNGCLVVSCPYSP